MKKIIQLSNKKYRITSLILLFVFWMVLFPTVIKGQNSGDYRTKQSGAWNNSSQWEKWDGSNWVTDGSPGSSNTVAVTIREGHAITMTNLDYSGTGNNITIDFGASLETIGALAGTSFNFNSLNVYGTFIRSSSLMVPSSGTIHSTGIYRHNVNGGTIPTLTWNSGSTLEITGVTNLVPTATAGYQNVVWNNSSQSATLILEGNFNSINGNFRLVNTSSHALVLGNTTTGRTMTIGGNFIIEGGTFALKGGTESVGNMSLVINGNYSQSGGTLQMSRRALATTGTATLDLKGNFTLTSGTITNIDATHGVGEIVFSRSGEQVYAKSGGTITNKINFTVNSGSAINLGTSIIDGSSGTFTLESGAGLITAHAQGISTTAATGSIQVTGSKTFNIGANYTFNSSVAQVTGNGLPSTINNLTINNTHTEGLTLTSSATINGVLNLSNGVLFPNSNTLIVGNTSSNAITGGSSTSFVSGPLSRTLPASASSGNYAFPVGKSGTYYPFALSNIQTGATTPVVSVQAFAENAGGTAAAGMPSMSTTEYWQATVASGDFTNSRVSLGKPSLNGSSAIGRSATKTGTYENINGTVSGNTIINSDLTSSSLGFFLMGSYPITVHGASGIPDGTGYPTLRDAFSAINATASQSGQDIEVRINASTTENVRALLNYRNWNSLVVYPTAADLSVSGNFTESVIRLNGVRNVTIDGRVNRAGSSPSLLIINNSSGGGASSVEFLNTSQYNILQYCKVQGQLADNSRGIVFLGSSSSGEGNSYNIIQYNEISGISETQRPRHAVASNGTSGRENLYNEIKNNKIFNFINRDAGANGIIMIAGSDYFTISGNSFYETVNNFEPQGGYGYYAIRTNSNSSHIVENNYIGGNAPEAQGTWTMIGKVDDGKIAAPYSFTAIYAAGKADEATLVKQNIIRGFNMTTGGSATNHDTWDGIFIQAGNVNVVENTIGATTGNALINVVSTNGGTISTSHGILNNSSGTINIVGNTIGSIEIVGAIDYPHSFESVYLRGSSGLVSVTDNLIGSTTTANSINVSSAATSATQKQDNYGIYSASQNTTIIKRNTIANLHNAYNGTITSSRTRGIRVLSGSNEIEDNIIYNISSASNQGAGINSAASVIGIESTANTAGTTQTIRGNTVYNLFANNGTATAVSAFGIYFSGPTNAERNIVERNFVHNITSTSTSNNTLLIGILLHRGNNTVFNNVVSLGATVTRGYRFFALWDDGGATNNNNVYFNTLSLVGNATGSTSISTAIWNQNASTKDYRNNILGNKRTLNSSGNNNLYAIRLASMANVTIDYNNYWTEGDRIGRVGGGPLRVALHQWRIATSQDANSIEINPEFQNASGNWTSPQDFLTGVLVALPGISLAPTISQDYDFLTRLSPPKMGAFENNNYVWYGTVSTDFNDVQNWAPSGNGIVPPNGADVTFATNPSNNCHLDQARTLRNINITNSTGSNVFVLNGQKLTHTGVLNFSNGATLNAKTASSVLELAGTSAQTLPVGSIVDNEFAGLQLNNEFGFTQNESFTIVESFTLSNGAYSIGANTLTINGSVAQTTGTLVGRATSNIIYGGSGSATILPSVDLNNLTINRANGINMAGNVSVGGTLALTDGTLTLGTNQLTISGNSPTGTSSVDASNSSATLVFNNSSAITLLPTFFGGNEVNNLSITATGGVTSQADFTVNGILNLQAANPSATKGSLDMFNIGDATDERKTLTMGATATTIGQGDVTGKVKRTTIDANTVYTFGSEFSTITFTGGTGAQLPNSITFIIKIGEEHPIASTVANTDFVQRHYEVIRDGGSSPTRFNLNLRYLDSELNGNLKSNMVFWDHHVRYEGLSPHEHGVSFHNTTDNYMALASHGIGYLVQNEYRADDDDRLGGTNEVSNNYSKIWLLANRNTPSGDSIFVWIGPYDSNTDWTDDNNWADNKSPVTAIGLGVPATKHYIYIQSGLSNAILPAGNFEAHSLFIEEGGVLETRSGQDIKLQYLRIFEGGTFEAIDNSIEINGAINENNGNVSWNNAGDFIAGTSTVSFTNANAAISGNTDFYNLSVTDGAKLSMINGSRIGIENTFNLNSTGILNATFFGNTIVDYNGAAQNVINPENNEYSTLIHSGSGTKTLPASLTKILGDFEINGTASATGTSGLTIDGNMSIESGATFASGNFSHTLKGNFENSGTFTPSSTYEMLLAGTTTQTILGTTRTAFADLNINNSANVQMQKSIDVNGELKLTAGSLMVGTDTLGINGTVSGTATIDVGTLSSLSFSGNSYTLPNDIFVTNPSVRNLIINKTSGQSIAPGNQDFTVLNSLTLASGILNISSNKITINGDISRTDGTMTTDATTELVFNENPDLLEIPNDMFTNADGVGTLTLNRAGGILLGNQDVLINSKLILSEGLLSTNSNLIIFGNASSVGTTASNNVPGSISSYINGCARKIGNTAFTYPIGTADEYAPIGISEAEGGGVNSDAFDACYFWTNPNTTYDVAQLDEVLDHVSTMEYWTLSRSAGTTNNVFVTLSWDDRSGPVSDIEQLVVAHWDGSKWESKGASSKTGDLGGGTIVSANYISSFSPFTLGSLTKANPLPVSMIAFEAVCNGDESYLWWQTATEVNNNYFEIEFSLNGIKWETIDYVSGAGNSNLPVSYRYDGTKLIQGALYRLKQVDYDGKFEYFGPVALKCDEQKMVNFSLYPNPAVNYLVVSSSSHFESLRYDIFNSRGQIVKSGYVSSGQSILDLSDLGDGAYFVRMENGFTERFVVLK